MINIEGSTATLSPSVETQIRERAIKVIRLHGWCPDPRYDIHPETRAVSLITALREATRPGYIRSACVWISNVPEYDQVLHDLDRELGGQSARQWSYAPGCTEDKVVALLRGVGA